MSDQKLVALTFDDGPTIGITDQVLDVLQENGVVASFFLIGQQITDETRYLVKRAHDMGCSIENHSKTHQSMPKLSRQEIVEEIQYTSGLIEEITGEKPAFFRPPFIDYDQKMYDLIDLGFICGYGCEDWLPSVTAQERIDRVLHDANPGFIILLHDMTDNTNTVEAIKTIIPELKKQGYEFVTVRDLFQKSSIKPQRNAIYMGVNEVREETPM
ncbi:MAG: polysaccharide deacetylase family protein [Lachnospiraceae bacterium]|nr:polysaccharide deacetylase family protein [Lachnospiraceae bacterium]